jgi:hypothetical protein
MPNKDLYRELELGGFVEPNGNIDRPLRPGWWPIFRHVEIRNKDIWWTAATATEAIENQGGTGSIFIEDQVDTDAMLDEFVALPEKMPAAYLSFVRKYGPLGLHDCLLRWMDKHNYGRWDRGTSPPVVVGSPKPFENASPLEAANHIFGDHFPDGIGTGPFSFPRPFPQPDADHWLEWTEPISVYRSLAVQFRGMLLCAKNINAGEIAELNAIIDARIRAVEERIEKRTKAGLSIRPEDYEEVEHLEEQKGIKAARNALQTFFANILEIADIQPRLNWTQSEWKIELCFPTALGALVLKMMMTAVRARCFYTCSGCGLMYTRPTSGSNRRRAPKAGQRNYCPACGIRAARLDAKRDYRHRLRASPKALH